MPHLSYEFWTGAIIAFVALLVGLGVTLAMDAKTKGEFRFASGCFLTSAVVAIYGIVRLQMSIQSPAWARITCIYVLLALVIVLAGEAVRWAKRRHEATRTGNVVMSRPLQQPPAPVQAQQFPAPSPEVPAGPKPKAEPTAEEEARHPSVPLRTAPHFILQEPGFKKLPGSPPFRMQITMTNVGPHSAFDMTGKIVIVGQTLGAILPQLDFSIGGEIPPNSPTPYYNDTVILPRNAPTTYIVLAIKYYDALLAPRNTYVQRFYMKWGGAKDGLTEPDFVYVGISERDSLKVSLHETLKDFPDVEGHN